MGKIAGFDLGTASISCALRVTEDDLDNPEELDVTKQIQKFSVITYKGGVGSNEKGEFSYAAERTKRISSRRLNRVRRYRIWNTLEILIENECCPLTKEDLDRWKTYDKSKGLKRQYPVDVIEFEQWVKLDFDGDGIPEYTSPYQLREELATVQLDFSQKINRFKLGRALYHIAQRRGFRSNKGETLKEQEQGIKDTAVDGDTVLDIESLKKSEETKSRSLVAFMSKYQLKTAGCAFAKLERRGIRIRANEYQAVRSQYREEIRYIFQFQKNLDSNGDFFRRMDSDKKDGTIFYKKPLRSQKGLVGKCTLEPSKPRCPISHPEFEKFRAFCFINTIRYRKTVDDEWQELTSTQKLKLYNEKFLRSEFNFKFEIVRKWLEKEIGLLKGFYLSKEQKTINYSDRTNVAGCPVSGRMKKLFGEEWEQYEYKTNKKRVTKNKNKNIREHTVSYTIEDIWHICFSYEDEEAVIEFARSLNLDGKQVKQFLNLWMAMSQGYAMLSLKAIRNINRFLIPQNDNALYKGYIYSEAVLLAKIPDIVGEERWQTNEKTILGRINDWISQTREEKRILNIANNLIAYYKSLDYSEQFAYKNTDYQLDNSDRKDVEEYTIKSFGEKTWRDLSQETRKRILERVAEKYQQFFASTRRDYHRLPQLEDTIKAYLSDVLQEKVCSDFRKLDKLYHPSMIEFYKPVKEQLGSPKIGSFKNPMAMRTLYQLRRLVNYYLKEGYIDEDTHIVVETARELNDANMRWALKKFQDERNKENNAISKAIEDLMDGKIASDEEVRKAHLLIEQPSEATNDKKVQASGQKRGKLKDWEYEKDVTKYRLWLEQGMRCIYTGKVINIKNLFGENEVDIEHTIPRSRSFDNSMANLTVCDAYYNRQIKKNRMPSELPDDDYEAILRNIQPWKDKIEQLKNYVDFWKKKSRQVQTKDAKDKAIRQKHLWQMELDYWQDKVSRFTMKEVPEGFKHSQLNDTRLITKYAYHYLKSLFKKVEVQRGETTAEFRKIFNIQAKDEKKSRDSHSHHAIDVAVLTLIPSAAKRDEMLELFYKKDEFKRLHQYSDMERCEQELQKLIRSCKAENVSSMLDFIDSNILINYVSKDKALIPAKRKFRKKGKVVWLKDENGKICVDEKGKKIPKYWLKGDSIRGKLHQESFYGAIKQSKDEKTLATSYKEISYVIRRELKYKKSSIDQGFANLEDLRQKIVDEHLYAVIKKQCEGKSFREACEEGFYMLNKNGEKVNRIRHIRCYTGERNPLEIRRHTYLSDKDYKRAYYAKVGDLYAMCRYFNLEKTKVKYKVVSLLDVAENRKYDYNVADVFEDEKTKEKFYLTSVLRAGMRVVIYKNMDELNELATMSNSELSKRLYVIRGFENPNRVTLVRHLSAKPEKDLGKGTSIKSMEALPEKIRQAITGINYLLEGLDFTISPDGCITFKKNYY